MAVNKVVYVENGVQKTLVDLTADTVTAETLKKGSTAHDKTGTQITGTMESSESGSSMKSCDHWDNCKKYRELRLFLRNVYR